MKKQSKENYIKYGFIASLIAFVGWFFYRLSNGLKHKAVNSKGLVKSDVVDVVGDSKELVYNLARQIGSNLNVYTAEEEKNAKDNNIALKGRNEKEPDYFDKVLAIIKKNPEHFPDIQMAFYDLYKQPLIPRLNIRGQYGYIVALNNAIKGMTIKFFIDPLRATSEGGYYPVDKRIVFKGGLDQWNYIMWYYWTTYQEDKAKQDQVFPGTQIPVYKPFPWIRQRL